MNVSSVATPPVEPAPYDREAELRAILPQVELVADDGENLDSDWHRKAISLLIDIKASTNPSVRVTAIREQSRPD